MSSERRDKALVALIGAPGAGKSTLARYLKEKYSFGVFITGDLFRRVALDSAPEAKTIQKYMSKRLPIAVKAIEGVVTEEIRNHQRRNKGAIIVDGIPRSRGQYNLLKRISPDWIFIHLDLPIEIALSRLSGSRRQRRADDQGTEIKLKGVEVYRNKILPMVSFIKNKELKRFFTLDATLPTEELASQVVKIIKEIR